jgi:hypothetical protein
MYNNAVGSFYAERYTPFQHTRHSHILTIMGLEDDDVAVKLVGISDGEPALSLIAASRQNIIPLQASTDGDVGRSEREGEGAVSGN